MIEIKGLVLSVKDRIVGYLVEEDEQESIWEEELLIKKSKDNNITGLDEVRYEVIDGKEYVFLGIDEIVTENVLYEVDKLNGIYSKKKDKSNINNENLLEFISEDNAYDKKIYRLRPELDNENYDTLHLTNKEKDYKIYFDNSVETENLLSIWNEVHVHSSNKGFISDCAHLWESFGCVVLSEKALNTVKDLIQGNAELLPLICEEGKYYLVNVTKYIDAVDYDRAIVNTLMEKYRVGFEKVALMQEAVENEHIFKVYIDDLKYKSNIFVSGRFRYLVLSNGLTGFKFEEIE